MSNKRRRFSDKFKAKVALESIKGVKTLNQLASEYKVSTSQISIWRKTVLTEAASLFSTKSMPPIKTAEEISAPLYEEIGRLKMDLKWLKKVIAVPSSLRERWISQSGKKFSVRRQCELAEISRGKIYYSPAPESAENLAIMREIDGCYLNHPEFGCPRMTDWISENMYPVNHKRIARLMKIVGLQAITPGPHTSKPKKEHRKYPYLLKNKPITHPKHVWSIDLTYIPMDGGYMCLTAIIDWFRSLYCLLGSFKFYGC